MSQNLEIATNLEEALKAITTREQVNSGWMFSVLVSVQKDPAFRKLASQLREEVEAVIAAVE